MNIERNILLSVDSNNRSMLKLIFIVLDDRIVYIKPHIDSIAKETSHCYYSQDFVAGVQSHRHVCHLRLSLIHI